MKLRSFALLASICSAPLGAQVPGAADWERGIEHFRAEDHRKAQTAFEAAVRADPERSEYHRWLGLSVGHRAQRMTGLRALGAMGLARQSREHFERAVEVDDSNLDALETLQGFHIRAPGIVGGSKEEAGSLAAAIEKLDPARGAAAWAALREAQGEFEEAEAQLARARELAPEEIGHLLRQAGFLARRGRLAESDELFDAAFERDPDNPDVWLAAGEAWAEAKRKSHYGRARELLERYLASPDRKTSSTSPFAVRKVLKAL